MISTFIKIQLCLFAYLVLLSDKVNQKQKIELPKEKVCLVRATFKKKKISTKVSLILLSMKC